jgi:hypothetical protein
LKIQNRAFIPFESFGDIKFGQHYVEVRKMLDAPFTQQYFDSDAKSFTDYFDELGFKVEYDKDNLVLGIEAYNDGNFDFVLGEKNLSKIPFDEIRSYLNSMVNDVEPYSIGFYSPSLGFAVCNDACSDDNPLGASSFCMQRRDYLEVNK